MSLAIDPNCTHRELVDRLLDEFHSITADVESIENLRRFLLSLALGGKFDSPSGSEITPQDIKELLLSSFEEKKIKNYLKTKDPIVADDLPISVENLAWARCGEVCSIEKGNLSITKATPGQFPLVTTADKRGSHCDYQFDRPSVLVPLVSSTGHGHASLKRIHYQEGKYAVGNILCSIAPADEELLSARFLFQFLSAFKDELLVSRMVGTANVSLTISKVADVPIPIVAKSVQSRIYNLMSLCDNLESKLGEREDLRERTTTSVLARLTAAPLESASSGKTKADKSTKSLKAERTQTGSTETLASAWKRLNDHFEFLIDTPESIDQLRETILQLAVQGKLVPQDSTDRPANVILTRLSEKTNTRQNRKYASKSIDSGQCPFCLPDTWEWTRVGTVCDLVSGKGFKASEYSKEGARLFQIANVTFGKTKWETLNYLPLGYQDSYPEMVLEAGDLVMALNRPLLKRRMKVALLAENDLPAILYQRVGKFIFYDAGVLTSYMFRYLQSPLFIDQLEESLQGSDQPFINKSQVVQFLMAIPPEAEQKRIVSKVSFLMSQCDELTAQLKSRQSTTDAVLSALIHQILEGTNE